MMTLYTTYEKYQNNNIAYILCFGSAFDKP